MHNRYGTAQTGHPVPDNNDTKINTKGDKRTSLNSLSHGLSQYEKLLLLSDTLLVIGLYDASIYWLHRMLQEVYTNNQQKAAIYKRLYIAYQTKGDYNNSMKTYLIAVESIQNEVLKAQFKINSASLFIEISDFEQSFTNIDDGLSIIKTQQDSLWIAIGLGIKASIYSKIDDWQQAMDFYREAYNYIANNSLNPTFSKVYNEDIIITRNAILNNIAELFYTKHAPDSMLYYLNKTLPEIDLVSHHIRSAIYIGYGEAYLLNGDLEQSLAYFNKGLAIAEQSGMFEIRVTAYKGLAKLYKQKKQFERALDFQQKSTEMYETTISKDNIQRINRLRTSYLLEKKNKLLIEKELVYNQKRTQLEQRNIQLAFLIASIVFSGITIGIFFRNQYNKNRFLNAQLKNAESEKLIAQIEASMNGEEKERERIAQELHDNVVSELIAMRLNLQDMEHHYPELKQSEKYNTVLYQTEEATDKLRRTTHNMMPARLKESGLAKALETFVERVGSHKMYIRFLCFGRKVKLNDATEKILLMIAHELIQNIIKHSKANKALVQLNYYEDTLGLTVEDNGVGIGKYYQSDKGMGWNNIHKNVGVVGGTIDIQSSEQEGTTILIEVPITTPQQA